MPGYIYQGEFNGVHFIGPNEGNQPDYSLSPDETKVVFDFWGDLSDGEQYKAKVTAYYSTGYYKAAAPVESAAYTYSGQNNNIVKNFGVSPVTVYTAGVESSYEVSVYWRQTQTIDGLTYELYKHESTGNGPWDVPEHVEWDKVVIPDPLPAADATGFRQFKLTGNNVPASRQAWAYKLVAKVGNEEVYSTRVILNSGVWSSPHIQTYDYNDPVSVPPDGSKKIKIVVEDQAFGLYAGEELEFYAAPSSLYNSSNQPTSSDAYLSQFTRIGGITKANLESSDSTKRTVTGTIFSAGQYKVIAVLKNGNTRTRISLYNNNHTEYQECDAYNVPN